MYPKLNVFMYLYEWKIAILKTYPNISSQD